MRIAAVGNRCRGFGSIGVMDSSVDVFVRVLGPLQVSRSGAPRELASRRQRALLAALAVRDGRPVPVSELVDAVWDDDPPEQARSTLQTYVSRLRSSLGQDTIRHDPAGYRLAPNASTDVAAVRAAVRRLERLDRDDHRARSEVALGALELWSGSPLGEFSENDWFRGHIVELLEARANLVDVAAEGLVETQRAPQAIALLEASLASDPLREPTQVALVRALHAAGRTADAVRAASRYRRQLREDTGLLPGPLFEQVEALALSGEPASAPTVADGLADWSSASLSRPTPIVGRVGELTELRNLVSWARLVTVTGVGGVGKTRLVAELLDQHTDGFRLLAVELAPVAPGTVASSLGSVLGARAERTDARTIAELLRAESVMLVLDNAEHVLDEVREVVRVVLDSCPGVRIVTTSRVRLELPDEAVLQLEPLATVGDRSDAAQLFVDRVLRARSRYDLEADDPDVAELCRRLDGVPLALELAAGRAAVLGVPALNDRLGSILGSLAVVHGGHGRHATLGNVVAWSVDLLGKPASALLAALSVFQGEFDLGAAEAIGHEIVDEPVPLLLGRLVDTSLVATSGTPGRYRLLEMVRAFASDRLAESDLVGVVRTAHAEWIASRVAEIEQLAVGPPEAITSSRFDAIRHETRSALRWAVGNGDVDTGARIAVSLAGPMLYRPDFELISEVRWASSQPSIRGAAGEAALLASGARAAFLLGHLTEVDDLAERALASAPDDAATRHRAQHALGVVRLYQGRFDAAAECFDRVVSDPDTSITDRLDALGGLGLALCYLGDTYRAQHVVDQHRGLSNTVASSTYVAFADYGEAEVLLARGDVDAAAEALTTATERAWDARAGFVWGIASTVLAGVLVRHRPPEHAREHLPVLVERWRRTATWPQLWTTLRLVAEHLAGTGHPDTALMILEAADHDASAPLLVGDDVDRDDTLRAELTDRLGAATASGIAAGATRIDRVAVIERALHALRTPLEPTLATSR